MTWCGIEGHDQVADLFRRSLAAGRLASTFLFIGPPGVGKRTFAQRLTQALLCERSPESKLAPCLACQACLQVEAGSHPDAVYVSKPADRAVLPIELFIGDLEHRGREGLCRWVSLKPLRGRRRIAIIDDADYFNEASANCLLKTLEEPPPNSVLLLIGTSAQRQLPTIRSRCQIVRFAPLPESLVRQQLVEQGIIDSPDAAAELARLSEGSLETARQFASPELAAFRHELWSRLVDEVDAVELAQRIREFVESVGKEAPKRRERLRHVIHLFTLFYRQGLFLQSGTTPPIQGAVANFAQQWVDQQPSSAFAGERLQRCIEALNELNANANLPTLMECWIDDLFPLETPSP